MRFKTKIISILSLCLILTLNITYAINSNQENSVLSLNADYLEELQRESTIKSTTFKDTSLNININKHKETNTNESNTILVDIEGNIEINGENLSFSFTENLYELKLETDSMLFGSVNGLATNNTTKVPIGLFIHSIPSQNKEMVSVTIGEGVDSEILVFGEAFKETSLIRDYMNENYKNNEMSDNSDASSNNYAMDSSIDREVKLTRDLQYEGSIPNGTRIGSFTMQGQKGITEYGSHTTWTLTHSDKQGFLNKFDQENIGNYNSAWPNYVYNKVIFPVNYWAHVDSGPDPGSNDIITIIDPWTFGSWDFVLGHNVSKSVERANGSHNNNSVVFEHNKFLGFSSSDMEMSQTNSGIPTLTRMDYFLSAVEEYPVVGQVKIGYVAERVFGSGDITLVSWTSPQQNFVYGVTTDKWGLD